MAEAALAIDRALDALRSGGVVAYPTETLYGLAVDAASGPALARLAEIKGRDGKPISVLVASRPMLDMLVERVPAVADRLMAAFWPGALTIALRARASVSTILTGGGETIAARISSHPVARELVERFGAPITSTSANPAGQPAPVEAAAVHGYFGSAVDVYVDGGVTAGGPGSTVIDCSGDDVVVVREGAIPSSSLEAAAGVCLRRR